jgi:type IX secretion system PorP/SprF family membrane protein
MIYRDYKKSKFYVTFLILNVVGGTIYCQQENSFNQYMFGHQILNPAYSGSKNVSNITSLSRSQWTGFEGAPISQSISFNSPIGKRNLGIGVSAQADAIGPLTNTETSLDFSYHLKFSDDQNWLSLGLKFGAQNFLLDTQSLRFFDRDDPSFNSNTKFIPNIGFGLYYYTPKLYLGFSIPRMIEDELSFVKRHFYFIGGGLISLKDNVQLKPSLLLKKTSGTVLAYDISLLMLLNNSYWFGPQFKSKAAFGPQDQILDGSISFLIGINLNENISIGYAYGNAINLGTNNSSSHELLLRFDFSPRVLGILRSPRIF